MMKVCVATPNREEIVNAYIDTQCWINPFDGALHVCRCKDLPVPEIGFSEYYFVKLGVFKFCTTVFSDGSHDVFGYPVNAPVDACGNNVGWMDFNEFDF